MVAIPAFPCRGKFILNEASQNSMGDLYGMQNMFVYSSCEF